MSIPQTNKELRHKHPDAVLIDITGTLKFGKSGSESSIRGFKSLLAKNIPYVLCTNSNSYTNESFAAMLGSIGYTTRPELIFTPLNFCTYYIKSRSIRPYLCTNKVIYDSMKASNPGCFQNGHNSMLITQNYDSEEKTLSYYSDAKDYDSVLFSDKGEGLNYMCYNKAFRILMCSPQPKLIVMGNNKFYMDADKELTVDNYAWTTGLVACANQCNAHSKQVEVVVGGKPNRDYFWGAIERLNAVYGLSLGPHSHILMIGDDIESDVEGAYKSGLTGVLLRTGKYLLNWESRSKYVYTNFEQVIQDINHVHLKDTQDN